MTIRKRTNSGNYKYTAKSFNTVIISIVDRGKLLLVDGEESPSDCLRHRTLPPPPLGLTPLNNRSQPITANLQRLSVSTPCKNRKMILAAP